MHMHTAQGRDPRAAGWLRLDRFCEEILARLDRLPPFAPAGAAVALPAATTRSGSPTGARPGRHVFHQAVPAPGGMKGLEALIGTDRRHTARPQPSALGAARLRAVGDGRVAVDHQDAPRAGRRVRRQRPARQHRRAARRGPRRDRPAARWTLEPTPELVRPARGSRSWTPCSQIGQLPGLVADAEGGRRRRALLKKRRARTSRRRAAARRTPHVLQRRADRAPQLRHRARCRSTRSRRCSAPHGVTMNDVVLAVVGGALRRWMQARGKRPTGVAGRRRPGGDRRRRGRRRGSGQPGLEHVHLAGHRHRRPARAAAGDLADHRRVQADAADARARTCWSTGCSSPRRRRSPRG